MKGWQFRWFTLDPDSGLLEYYVVSSGFYQWAKLQSTGPPIYIPLKYNVSIVMCFVLQKPLIHVNKVDQMLLYSVVSPVTYFAEGCVKLYWSVLG